MQIPQRRLNSEMILFQRFGKNVSKIALMNVSMKEEKTSLSNIHSLVSHRKMNFETSVEIKWPLQPKI